MKQNFNIYSAERAYQNTYGKTDYKSFNCVQMRNFSKNAFSVHLLYGMSFSNVEYLSVADPIIQCI